MDFWCEVLQLVWWLLIPLTCSCRKQNTTTAAPRDEAEKEKHQVFKFERLNGIFCILIRNLTP